MASLPALSFLTSYDEVLPFLQQFHHPVFLIIHQHSVDISKNYFEYLKQNISYLKSPVYFIDFELCRSQLLALLRESNVDFSHFGFPCVLMFYKVQFVYVESGAITIASMNELVELSLLHFAQQLHSI